MEFLRTTGRESWAFIHLASCPAGPTQNPDKSHHCTLKTEVSAANGLPPVKQIPAMTVLGGNPMTGIAGLFPTFTFQLNAKVPT
jgi:hypothetical protein